MEGKKENQMREIRIEKILLSIGGTAEELDKGYRLLQLISGKKPVKTKAKKRIPGFGIRPGLEIGCKVTIRENIKSLLDRLLEVFNKKLKEKQIQNNYISFGIKEYIEIAGIEYQRDIGMLGLNVTVVFSRKGKRVERRRRKRNKIGKKQNISRQEIIDFMKKNYGVEINGSK